MASPVDTLKSSLFGQLKSYGNAVQGVFEQRIARPILAFKRDLSRPTSETRGATDRDADLAYRVRQGSTSSSSPLEIIDIEASGSIKSIFDKVKNTLSPATKRRTSDNATHDDARKNSKPPTEKISRKHRLQSRKSVSFADDVDNDSDSSNSNSNNNNTQFSSDDRNRIVRNAQSLADRILMESIDEIAQQDPSSHDRTDNARQPVRSTRTSTADAEDLVYQDLSAEIVAYVLKNALRTLKKEYEQEAPPTKRDQLDEHDDFIDLK